MPCADRPIPTSLRWVTCDCAGFSQVLTCCGSKDFELTRCVAAGQNGIVFAARCLRKGMPKPSKLFALKLIFNFGLSTAATRNTFENEFNVLSRLPPHNNITRFWTQFVDEVWSVPCFPSAKECVVQGGTACAAQPGCAPV